jgi:hypothetical protein
VRRERPAAPRDDAWSGDPGAKRTDAQSRKLWAGLRRLGYSNDDRDAVLALLGGWIGRELDSTTNLTVAEAGKALDCLTAEELRARDPESGGYG